MLSAIMPNAIMLNAIMLNAILLSVFMLSECQMLSVMLSMKMRLTLKRFKNQNSKNNFSKIRSFLYLKIDFYLSWLFTSICALQNY